MCVCVVRVCTLALHEAKRAKAIIRFLSGVIVSLGRRSFPPGELSRPLFVKAEWKLTLFSNN